MYFTFKLNDEDRLTGVEVAPADADPEAVRNTINLPSNMIFNPAMVFAKAYTKDKLGGISKSVSGEIARACNILAIAFYEDPDDEETAQTELNMLQVLSRLAYLFVKVSEEYHDLSEQLQGLIPMCDMV